VINITGTANFTFTGTAVTINYELTGIEPACETAGPEPNSCGIHIHSGTSCDTQAQQDGHYYNPAIADDPWKSIVYTTGTNTTGEVEYGYTAAETFGKVFIVHDYDGKRVTCIPVTSSCL
jgi:Cu/Zn superoxide dismutase